MRKTHDSALTFSLCAVFMLGAVVQARALGEVITVGPAGDVPLLQTAIDIAADGDHIVLLESNSNLVRINGKSLTVAGIDETILMCGIDAVLGTPSPTFTIENLAPDQSVVIRRLNVDAISNEPLPAISIENCLGAVHLERCAFGGGFGPAVSAFNSSSVTISDCSLTAGEADNQGSLQSPILVPQPGLAALDSTVSVYDSSITGSSGPDAQSQVFTVWPPADGGQGCRVNGSSTILLAGCNVTGGSGGAVGAGSLCFDSGDGGHALTLGSLFGAPLVRVRDTQLAGGQGGVVAAGCAGAVGADGLETEVTAGTIAALAGAARSLTTNSFVVEGDDVTLSFRGEPGDTVTLLTSASLGPSLFFAPSQTTLHLALPFLTIPLTTVPASGTLEIAAPVPLLPGGLDFVTVPVQALFFTSPSERFTSGPSAIVLYSASAAP